MKLRKGIWKKKMTEEVAGFCIFYPEQKIVINISELAEGSLRYLVWGCHIIDLGDGHAVTNLGNQNDWQKEAYKYIDSELHWTTVSGKTVVYQPISASELPVDSQRRIEPKVNQIEKMQPPPYRPSGSGI